MIWARGLRATQRIGTNVASPGWHVLGIDESTVILQDNHHDPRRLDSHCSNPRVRTPVPITIQCPNCTKTLQVADGSSGKIICCPACESAFEIHTQEEELVEPLEDSSEPKRDTSGITQKPAPLARKAVWDDDEPPAKAKKASSNDDADELYGFDADDEEERDDRARTREAKEKRRRFEDAEDLEQSCQPHQGIPLFVLGIVALGGACFCAILGWGFAVAVLGMADTDLAKMDNRVMDPSGRSLTIAARACALVAFGLGLMNFILVIAMFVSVMNNTR
jgi:phage FluMu protein Com